MKRIIGAQGEITIIAIDALPTGIATKPVERTPLGHIIATAKAGTTMC
jgi:hypothetical protein